MHFGWASKGLTVTQVWMTSDDNSQLCRSERQRKQSGSKTYLQDIVKTTCPYLLNGLNGNNMSTCFNDYSYRHEYLHPRTHTHMYTYIYIYIYVHMHMYRCIINYKHEIPNYDLLTVITVTIITITSPSSSTEIPDHDLLAVTVIKSHPLSNHHHPNHHHSNHHHHHHHHHHQPISISCLPEAAGLAAIAAAQGLAMALLHEGLGLHIVTLQERSHRIAQRKAFLAESRDVEGRVSVGMLNKWMGETKVREM